ncbi:MAG: hypothetical protein PHT83_00355 [Bacilli bacterium]|nr:hypothetical protein [Bacilli bacterium]
MEKLDQEILQLYLKQETINFFPKTSLTVRYLDQIKELNEYYNSLSEDDKESISNQNILEKLLELREKILGEYNLIESKEEALKFDEKILECRDAKSTNHTWFYRVRKLAADYDKLEDSVKKMCINKWIIDSMLKEISDYEKSVAFDQLKKEAVVFDKRILDLKKNKNDSLDWVENVKETIEDFEVLALPVKELLEKNSILITLRQEAFEFEERINNKEFLKAANAFDNKIAELQKNKVWTLDWYQEVQELESEYKYLKAEVKNLLKKEGVLLTLKQEAIEVYESFKMENIKDEALKFDDSIKALEKNKKPNIEWANQVIDLDREFSSLESLEKDVIKQVATLATLKQEALEVIDKFKKNDYYMMANEFDTAVLTLDKNRALTSSWASAVVALEEKYNSFENIAKNLVKEYGKLINLKQEAISIKSRIKFGEKNEIAMKFDDKVSDTLKNKTSSEEWIKEVEDLEIEYNSLDESIKELVTKALVLSELKNQAREVKHLLDFYKTKATAITFDQKLIKCKEHKSFSLEWYEEVMALEKEYKALSLIVKEVLDNKGMIETLKHDAFEIRKQIFDNNYKQIANEIDNKITNCEKRYQKTEEWIKEVEELKKMFDGLSLEIKAFCTKTKLLDFLIEETKIIKKAKAIAVLENKASVLDNEIIALCDKVSKEEPLYKQMLHMQDVLESTAKEVLDYLVNKKIFETTLVKSFKFNRKKEKNEAKRNKKNN